MQEVLVEARGGIVNTRFLRKRSKSHKCDGGSNVRAMTGEDDDM